MMYTSALLAQATCLISHFLVVVVVVQHRRATNIDLYTFNETTSLFREQQKIQVAIYKDIASDVTIRCAKNS